MSVMAEDDELSEISVLQEDNRDKQIVKTRSIDILLAIFILKSLSITLFCPDNNFLKT